MSDQSVQSGDSGPFGNISRRGMLRGIGAGAAIIGAGGLLEACSSGIKGSGSSSGGTKAITIADGKLRLE